MSRLHRAICLAAVFSLAMVSGLDFSEAQQRTGSRRVGSDRVVLEDHVVAFSALEPVGTETGWGRLVVRDDQLPDALHRTVKVWLFGLEPATRYEVEAEGVSFGTIKTDLDGDGFLQLQNWDEGSGEVPSGLPPAEEIGRALVTDPALAVVLEGTFSIIRQDTTDDVAYEEKIILDDVGDGTAYGMAGVRLQRSGSQQFVTRASKLEPGDSFRIVVDELEVGIVTADDEGQAVLELECPSDENPLPSGLKPVADIRVVQWFQGETLQLTGTFTGNPDREEEPDKECIEERGTVVEIGDHQLVLEVDDDRLVVLVTEDTQFVGDLRFDEIGVGDVLIVEGCFDGEALVAYWLAMAEKGEEEECLEVRGKIASISGDGFVLMNDDGSMKVLVTDETLFKEAEWPDGFGVGDKVTVEGCLDGRVLVASWVLLVERAVERECAELRGTVLAVGDGEMRLRVGDDELIVVFTHETVFKEVPEGGLGEGDVVVVEGCFDGEVLVAYWVLLVEDADAPECVELRGTVLAVGDGEMRLRVGDDELIVVFTHETVFKEVPEGGLGEGDVVVVEGCFDGEVLVAYWVLLVEDADAETWFEVNGNVVELFSGGFYLTTDGDTIKVIVGGDTDYVEVQVLDDLLKGDYLFVEGPYDGEILHAVLVQLIGRPK